MFGSLAHGLPQVILPQGADNFLNGDLVARAGAGRTLGPEDVSAAAIGSALEAVLDDPSYAGAAGRIAAEIAAQSPPDDVARALRTRFAS
jgi:UDP:flavonoid glycosyltransferase YjiC (YdhE family)